MENECGRLSGFITPYVDGELENAQRSELERHLQSCGRCHAFYLQERDVKKVIHDRMPILAAPLYVAQRIHHKLFAGRPQPSFWNLLRDLFHYRPLATSISVAALILFIGFPTYLLSISGRTADDRLVAFAETGEVVELEGQIICIDCEFTHGDPQNRTPHTNVHRIGIKCSANKIWTVLDTRQNQELLHNHEYLHKNVLVSGVAYQDARYLYVKNYRLL